MDEGESAGIGQMISQPFSGIVDHGLRGIEQIITLEHLIKKNGGWHLSQLVSQTIAIEIDLMDQREDPPTLKRQLGSNALKFW